MIKAYLLVYSKDLGTRPRIKSCLNSLPQVLSWRAEIPNSFFILSEAPAAVLSKALLDCLGTETPRYIITRVSLDRHGWLAQDSWDFLQKGSPDLIPKK